MEKKKKKKNLWKNVNNIRFAFVPFLYLLDGDNGVGPV